MAQPPDGPAGGKLQSRSSVAADPTPSIYVSAVGSIFSPQPAHKLGLEGSAYRYGGTTVAGTKNLAIRDGYAVAIETGSSANINAAQKLGLGVAVGDALPYIAPNNLEMGGFATAVAGLNSNGVMNGNPEVFASPGTVTVTNGSSLVTGAGTAFLADTVTSPVYGYTQSLPHPALGDYIVIGGKNYIIIAIIDATHLHIYPPYESANAAGQAYTIKRYGFFSRSRIIQLPISGPPAAAIWYSVTNAGDNVQLLTSQPIGVTHFPPTQVGSIGAWGTSTFTHYTAPVTTPANLPVTAADIAYYKGFLLYGGNTTVAWSVNPFPSAFPFGANDFPDTNTTVIDPADVFVGFEYLGDQLVALFENSLWLVVPTGSVPEFNFYRLPENRGCLPNSWGVPDTVIAPLFSYYLQGRPHCSASGAIYYVSAAGVIEFTGSIGKVVSNPVIDLLNKQQGTPTLWWDKVLDAIIVSWRANNSPHLMYFRQSGAWTQVTGPFSPHPCEVNNVPPETVAPGTWATAWFESDGFVRTEAKRGNSVDTDDIGNGTVLPWSWASPVLNLSDIYDDFTFGGFAIDAHGSYTKSTPPSVSWQVYGGYGSYNLALVDSGTYSYKYGTVSSRDLIGQKQDFSNIAIVLTGTDWVKLDGVQIFDARTRARR